jgi:predicted SAM-dependent methyltransferase
MERVRLNLGAGLQNAPGWTNYDRSRVVLVARRRWLRKLLRGVHNLGLASKPDVLDWPADTRSLDVTKGLPHPDGSVDAIYTSHMLEHLTPDSASFVLVECHRVLKPGGALRVVVPDLRLGVSAFLEGDRRFFELRDDEPIADGFVAWLAMRAEKKGGLLERLARRVMRTDEGGHRWMYDAESLTQRLAAAGFAEVTVQEHGISINPEAAALDSRPHDSLHIDAIKPTSASAARAPASLATRST